MVFASVLFLLMFGTVSFGQFEVEFNEIKGSLTKKDEFKKGFGRYDGIQIPLYKNEAVNFVVYSDKFSPRLMFLTPGGKPYKQSESDNGDVASLISSVSESGDWLLFVVGDSSAQGNYTLQYAIAGANSLELPKGSDFCTTLDFIVAHANAYFLLFENPVESKQAFVKLNGAEDAFIDESDGSYTAKMYEGNDLNEAQNKFDELSKKIDNCFGKDWSKTVQSWTSTEDYKVKTVMYAEKFKSKQRYVLLGLKDLRSSKQKFIGDYVIEIVVNKRN